MGRFFGLILDLAVWISRKIRGSEPKDLSEFLYSCRKEDGFDEKGP